SFNKVMKRFDTERNKVHHKIIQYPYTIAETKLKLQNLLMQKQKVSFVDVLLSCENKIHAIFTFLSVLELLQEQLMKLTLGEGFNNFWLSTQEYSSASVFTGF